MIKAITCNSQNFAIVSIKLSFTRVFAYNVKYFFKVEAKDFYVLFVMQHTYF